ncbi:MAG: ABC transporter permease [Dysgonomonas sp.]
MLKHYFTIAFRNLLKYRPQTLISVIGLAVGFVCFSLSTVWIQHERSFDNFHPKSHRIYQLFIKSEKETSSYLSLESIKDLKTKYPEIEDVVSVSMGMQPVATGTPGKDLYVKRVSESFFDVFDVSVTQGLKKGTTPSSIAITDKAAKILFTNQDPIGKEVVSVNDNKYNITDVVSAWPPNTRLEFDMLEQANDEYNLEAYILMKEGADVKLLAEKLLSINSGDKSDDKKWFEIIPITEVRQYESNNSTMTVKYDNIKTFVFMGLLIIICAFLNYMLLFLNRIRIRKSELALRKVNGASDSSFILLFGGEFVLLLSLALLVSGILIQLILPEFKTMSEITLGNTDIYIYGLIYSLILAILVFSVSIIPLQYYKSKTLQQVINKQSGGGGKNIFYRTSIVLQLVIGIGFSFCTVVFIKQVQFMQRKTIGYDYTNVSKAEFNTWNNDAAPLVNKIEGLADVTEVLLTGYDLTFMQMVTTVSSWDGKEGDSSQSVKASEILVPPNYFSFYKMVFLAGKSPDINGELSENTYYINRAAAKAFGWNSESAIGKKVDNRTVAGVFEDCVMNPKVEVKPVIARQINTPQRGSYIYYRYAEGKRKEAEEAITKIIEEAYPSEVVSFMDLDEFRAYYFQNEEVFLKIMKLATVVCLIISLFGVYSMILLICTKQRKEIAIRKVNGASMQSILYSLLREQLILVVIAALIAFPIGYKIMKVWIEGYLKQTEISWWIFPLIFIGILLVIIATVFSQVWRAANANPAEVLKSE